jgi:hypothetical protein
MILSISRICQTFNLSSVCVSLLLDIGWFKCLIGQNGDCLSVCGKEGVLWGVLLTGGWEGLVYTGCAVGCVVDWWLGGPGVYRVCCGVCC